MCYSTSSCSSSSMHPASHPPCVTRHSCGKMYVGSRLPPPMSSDSEVSENEGWSASRPGDEERARCSALACIHILAKNHAKSLFPHWNMLVADLKHPASSTLLHPLIYDASAHVRLG